MRWSHVDLDRAWEITATDMKAGNPHIVPLSASVTVLLEARRKGVSADSIYVLEGGRSRRHRLGVTEAIGIEDFAPHDLRRTAATGMARAGVSALWWRASSATSIARSPASTTATNI